MDLSGFVKQVGIVVVGALVLGGYPLYAYADAAVVWAGALGCGICVLNALAGCASAVWAFEKPHKVFVRTLFGGMAVRLLAMGLAFFLLIKFTGVHVLGLAISLFLFYVLFQILEIRFLMGHLPTREVSKEGT